MADRVSIWRNLVDSNDALVSAAAEVDASDVAAVARLRKQGEADLVHAALDLGEARRRAATKFPHAAAQLVADREGVEQASSQRVADYKAGRLAAVCPPAARVIDLCSGIGGDTMSLARAMPGRVTAIDLDPLRAWMTHLNSGAPAAVCNAADVDLTGAVVHIDPARRNARGRRHDLADAQPGPDVLRQVMRQSLGGAIKLGPGVDKDALRAELIDPFAGDTQLEFISENGVLVQAVLWFGAAARDVAPMQACVLPRGEGEAAVVSGDPAAADFGDADVWAFPDEGASPDAQIAIARYLHAVDPAVERAELLDVLASQVGATVVHPRLGLLAGDEPLSSAFLTTFECLAEMPWRLKRVKQWLAERDGGTVEVKTRGGVINTDTAAQTLRGEGDVPHVVFVLRVGRAVRAVLARRLLP